MFFFLKRLISENVCTACSRRNNRIEPLTNLNKHLYNGKSEIKGNKNNSSEEERCYLISNGWENIGACCICFLQTEATNNEAVNVSDPVCHDTLNFIGFCVSLENQALAICSLQLC
jgi:hypothetical protein